LTLRSDKWRHLSKSVHTGKKFSNSDSVEQKTTIMITLFFFN
jgi:hypothetical protein